MKKKFSTMKLQNRFLLILLLALTISATLFELLWLNKMDSGKLDRQF